MTSPKSPKKPIVVALLATWAIGCLAQYYLCCPDRDNKVAEQQQADAMSTVVKTADETAEKTTNTTHLSNTETVSSETTTAQLVTDEPAETATTDSENVEDEKVDSESTAAETVPVESENVSIPDSIDETNTTTDAETTEQVTETSPAPSAEVEPTVAVADTETVTATNNHTNSDNIQAQIAEAPSEAAATAIDAEAVVEEATVTPSAEPEADEQTNEEGDEEKPQDMGQDADPVPSQHAFSLKGDGIDLHNEANFNFISGEAQPVQSIVEALDNNLSQMVDYLQADSARQLTVTGLYHPDEDNASVFSSIGLARANQIREYLVALGADSKQIDIADKAYPEAIANKNQQYFGMADFSVATLDNAAQQAHEQAMQQLADEIRAQPLTLYFKSGNSRISLDAQQRQKLAKIIRYLSFDKAAAAVITGHTDNVGGRQSNIKLAQSRAVFAAEQLETKGLLRQRMQIQSKGPDVPIASNATAEGRAKNRRVEISINETHPKGE